MAKGKSVPYVWICQAHREVNGQGWAQKDKIKDMVRMKYCARDRKRVEHKAKAVKKGGTKALVNMK